MIFDILKGKNLTWVEESVSRNTPALSIYFTCLIQSPVKQTPQLALTLFQPTKQFSEPLPVLFSLPLTLFLHVPHGFFLTSSFRSLTKRHLRELFLTIVSKAAPPSLSIPLFCFTFEQHVPLFNMLYSC